jgi:phenylalanyl-tRNA synthetase alpha chain
VESVALIDDFTNKKTNKRSNCFRITYRSMERSLTNEEIDNLQMQIRSAMEGEMALELR